MNRFRGAAAGLLALVLAAAIGLPGRAQDQGPAGGWLHVRVDEGQKGSKVAVNLPLSVVEIALKAAPETLESHGKVRLGRGDHDLSLSDLRKLWAELKKAGDTDFVSVEGDDDEDVKVGRRGDTVEVHVTKGQKEHVSVQVPVSLVDAALSGEGEGLDVRAALIELQKRRGDIVRVTDEHGSVRIWIDDQVQGR